MDQLRSRIEELVEDLKHSTNKISFVENQLIEREQALKVTFQDLQDVQE